MRVGFLHPGEMGISLAVSALNSGQEVYWVRQGRSQATCERANKYGLKSLPDLAALTDTCEVLIAVCPPHAAVDQARVVMHCGFKGIYADVNAISPQTLIGIATTMQQAEVDFVDGGIIGLPAWQPGATWLYLSGSKAATVAQCFHKGPLETEILGNDIGMASALKMCFAANTKGTTALQTAVLGAAEKLGVRSALETQWERYNPGATEKTHARIRNAARKAWRFTGEMHEIAKTFRQAGMPPDFHLGAADIYARESKFKGAASAPSMEAIVQALQENN